MFSTLYNPPAHYGAFPHATPNSLFRLFRNLALRLLICLAREGAMDALVIGGTLLGSLAGAFVLQKVALEGLLRIMNGDRKLRG
jgi:hypothetical protein